MKRRDSEHPGIKLSITTDQSGRKTLHVNGEIDLSTSLLFGKSLAECIADYDGELLLDLTHVDFMDSSALHCLIEATREIISRGGSVTLRKPGHTVYRLLEVSGLLGYFHITP